MNNEIILMPSISLSMPMEAPLIGHLTVVESVYFQSGEDQPTVLDTGFAKVLSAGEQPYARTLSVGEDWQLLCKGCWLEESSCLVIENLEARLGQVQPSEEEKRHKQAKVIEVSCDEVETDGDVFRSIQPSWLVHPGETLRAQPANLNVIKVRCRRGTAKISLTVFPL